MFETVLVANRGEIAVRVIRTLRALGIRSVAVYSDADADAPHVRAADVAVRLGPAAAAQSYLSIERVIAAARATGAQAIHPGYGFLSENTAFAAACATGRDHLRRPAGRGDRGDGRQDPRQADRRRGRRPGRAGVGRRRALRTPSSREAAARVGYPVLLKPSAGGGGKGMREVHRAGDLADAIASARREARGAFGDDTLLVERLVTTPRHIEIQVLADAHGNVIHLGERECSLQRRHQKIVEEAPSPLLTPGQRAAMGAAACAAARACGYTGAGTVEFIVAGDRPDDWFFMEMNTRLQVEHPVTEEVTGLDLVELQLRVAAGEPLPLAQDDVVAARARGRGAGLRRRPGRRVPAHRRPVLALREPRGLPGVRVDSGIAEGTVVGSDYDPMLSKIIAHGADRAEALHRLDAALGRTVLLGPRHERRVPAGAAGRPRRARREPRHRPGRPPDRGAGRGRPARRRRGRSPPASRCSTWSRGARSSTRSTSRAAGALGEPAWTTRRAVADGHDPVEVRSRGRAADAELVIGGRRARPDPHHAPTTCHTQDGITRGYAVACGDDGVLWVSRDGRSWAIREQEALEAAAEEATGAGGPVLSPMPGTVTVVEVVEGQRVAAGQQLVAVEAMKMEHVLTAPVDGTVRELRARPGAAVAKDAVLLVVEADGAG